jgi:hypothetical protein
MESASFEAIGNSTEARADGSPRLIERLLGSKEISNRQSAFGNGRMIGNDAIIALTECASSRALRLYEYWGEVCGARKMPRRQDIDAIQIWSLLPYIHLSEWHGDPDRVYYRIAGTELVATAGHELRGRWLNDIQKDPADYAQILSLYQRVIAARAPIFGRTDSSSLRIGVEFFEWVLCPLSDDGETVSHFIGLEDYVSTRRYLGGISQ